MITLSEYLHQHNQFDNWLIIRFRINILICYFINAFYLFVIINIYYIKFFCVVFFFALLLTFHLLLLTM